jgi:hypothetical protein
MHGRIWFEDEAWWIEDRNSSRGTRLGFTTSSKWGRH